MKQIGDSVKSRMLYLVKDGKVIHKFNTRKEAAITLSYTPSFIFDYIRRKRPFKDGSYLIPANLWTGDVPSDEVNILKKKMCRNIKSDKNRKAMLSLVVMAADNEYITNNEELSCFYDAILGALTWAKLH